VEPVEPGGTSGTSGTRTILTVSELNATIRDLLENSLTNVWVEGEISNARVWNTGHMYFTLKDGASQIKAVMFRSAVRYLKFKPEDGLKVVARGKISVYDPKGEYQILCEHLEPKGLGSLQQAFEQLKKKLAAEGLFDPARKRPLPALPRRIGIVTSLDGAALRDIIRVLRRRYPNAHLVLSATRVQGEGAAREIAHAIRKVERIEAVDVIILARGGGSLEDLWAFNEEVVARAIHTCPIPIVCGVGHETDITIADFVADARAPTPTAAAELLSPHQSDWLSAMEQKEQRLVRLLRDRLRTAQQHLDYLSTRLVHPRARLARLDERLQMLGTRLRLAQFHVRDRMAHTTLALHARLLRRNPQAQLREHQLRNRHLRTHLGNAMRRLLERTQERVARTVQTLDTLSPLATLARGYAILENPTTGVVVRAAGDVQPGDTVRARLARGLLDCRVEKVHNDA
jgi:exodeoxyribonuclease VII large subunit